MKISEYQLLILFCVGKGTLAIDENIGGYTREERLKLITQILDQQDEKLVNIGKGLVNKLW